MFDSLVVGAGFAGATIAERLAADAGKKVLVCDRRPHIGGNAYDHYDAAGILVHKYGPHIFHTNSREVFDYLSRFTEWRPYEHRVKASVDGKLLPIPINLDTVNELYGLDLSSDELTLWFAERAEPVERARTSEDVVVGTVGRDLEGTTRFKRMVYTGPVDEYFGYCYGKLPYRSLHFEFETHERPLFQAAPVVNYPGPEPHTRIT